MTRSQLRWKRILVYGRNAWRGCGGKTIYPSKRCARAKAEAVEQRIGSPMGFYRCAICGRWHIGHDRRRAA